MTVKKPAPLAISLLGCAALAFALVAAKCESHTEFTDFVDEDCADGADNDEDGKKDCADTDCAIQCAVEVDIFEPPPFVDDTLKISGTHLNAASIAIQVTPSGTGGPAKIEGQNWNFAVTGVSGTGIHTIKAIASSTTPGLKDTATVNFQKED